MNNYRSNAEVRKVRGKTGNTGMDYLHVPTCAHMCIRRHTYLATSVERQYYTTIYEN